MSIPKAVTLCEAALLTSIQAREYGDIRSILDEMLAFPTWAEQVHMSKYLNVHVQGAMFDYDALTGWGYVEDDDGVTLDMIKSSSFKIQVAGERYPASASLTPMYDRKGERVGM